MHFHEAVYEDARPNLPLLEAQPEGKLWVVEEVGAARLAAAELGREELEERGFFRLHRKCAYDSDHDL